MKFIEKNGNITIMGWKLVTIRVSSNDDLSEKRIAEPGVYFLVDEKTCYSEPEDMSRHSVQFGRQRSSGRSNSG